MPKIARKESPIIRFSEEDARRLHHPHDDTLVVSIQIEDYNMHRVLVDNGSSIDILYYPAFQQIGIGREWLIPMNAPLVSFGGTRVLPLGAIILSVVVGDYPQQIVTSTYHLMIKFPTDYGVGELRGNQVAAREYYVAMMEMDDHLQAMSIEEHQTTTKPVEKLEEVFLND